MLPRQIRPFQSTPFENPPFARKLRYGKRFPQKTLPRLPLLRRNLVYPYARHSLLWHLERRPGELCVAICAPPRGSQQERPVSASNTLSVRSILGRILFPLISLCLLCANFAAASTVNISAIQTDLPSSPYLGQTVTTSGIVIAVLPDGFYIENSSMDSDVCTAEGIFVYTGSGNVPSSVALQDAVTVTGEVVASNSSSYAGTQIDVATPIASNVSVTATGQTLPTTISASTLTSATQGASGTCSSYTAGTFGDWLPFEGMRVNVPSSSSLYVVGPTGGTLDRSTETATTNGQFWAILYTSSSDTRPMRTTGISDLETVPSTAPSTVQRWSGNPQLLLVDTTALGGTALEASAGTYYTGSSNLVGIIDYHVSAMGYTGLLLDSSTVAALTASKSNSPTPASTPATGVITVATQNLDSLTSSETTRIAKLAKAIVSYENSPDVLNLQGATPAALTALKSAISSAGGPDYADLSTYSSADSSGLVNAIFFNAAKFTSSTTNPPAITLPLTTNTYTTTSSTTATLFDRTPLKLHVGIPRTGTTDFDIEIVNASMLSRDTIDDTSAGAETRLHREKQAEQLAVQVLEPLETNGDAVFVAGGFESFEFSDGYVDTMGILAGSQVASSLVTLHDATENSSTLVNLATTATNANTSETNAATSRYTVTENGSAEQTDQILVTSNLSDLVKIDYARIGADFPVSDTYVAASTTVARASSHDGVVAYLTVPYPTTTTLTASPASPAPYGKAVTFTATVTSNGGVPTGSVTFTNGSSTLCTAVALVAGTSDSTATCTTESASPLSVGTHTITATYSGDAAFYTSSKSISYVVTSDTTTITLASSLNPSYVGTSLTFTATLVGSYQTPTGSVRFSVDGSTAATSTLAASSSDLTSTATYTTATLAVGSHSIVAKYAGDTANDAATSSTLTQVVNAVYTTSSTLTCTPNPAAYQATVACTDTVNSTSGTPSGTVTFYDGSTEIGSSTLSSSGIATISTATLTVGSHSITAVYAANNPWAASTSNAVDEIILSSFSIALTPTTQSIYTGEAASYTLTVTPESGFTLDVSLACSGLPNNASCTFASDTITGGSGSTKLTIQTSAPSKTTSAAILNRGKGAIPLLAGVLLLLLPRKSRKSFARWTSMGALLVMLGMMMSLSACSSSGTLTGGTTAGTYTITVTGTAKDGTVTLTKTATTSLTVKSLF